MGLAIASALIQGVILLSFESIKDLEETKKDGAWLSKKQHSFLNGCGFALLFTVMDGCEAVLTEHYHHN
jgi:hypothetical protein